MSLLTRISSFVTKRSERGSALLVGGPAMSSGTPWRSSRPSIDPNTLLNSLSKRAGVFREMQQTDPIIAAGVADTLDAMASAKCMALPPRTANEADAAIAREIADACNRQWGWAGYSPRLEGQTWGAVVRGLGQHFANGIAMGVRDDTYDITDGKRWTRRLRIPDIASIDEWERDDRGHITHAVQRWVTGQSGSYAIPVSEAVIVTHRLLGNDVEGIGILRALYFPYKLKQRVMESMGIASDRLSVPIPQVAVDRDELRQMGFSDTEIESVIAAAEAQAQNLVAKSQAFVRTEKGIEFSTLADGVYDPSPLIAMAEWCDLQFAMAFHTQHERLGLGDTGARNIGEIQRNGHLRFAARRLDAVLEALRMQWAVPFVAANWGPRAACDLLPQFVHRGLEPSKLAEWMAHIPGALAQGALRLSVELQDALNEEIGLPANAGRSDEWWADLNRARARSLAKSEPLAPSAPGPGRGNAQAEVIADA